MKLGSRLKILIVLLVPLAYSHANDGPYALIGDTLHPQTSTEISLDYERLIITHDNGAFEVDVYIELYNHSDTVLEPAVGFEFAQAPVYREIFSAYSFRNFVLLVNNVPQSFSFEFVEDLTDNGGGEETFGTSILLYRPKLNPGINKIYHNYKLDREFNAPGYFQYILKTGSRWKGGTIKDFEIIVKTNVPGVFFCNRNEKDGFSIFDIVGEGKPVTIERIAGENIDGASYSLNKGYLYKNIKNFTPTQNLGFWFFPFLMDYYWGDMLPPSVLDTAGDFAFETPRPMHKYLHSWKNSLDRKDEKISAEYEAHVSGMDKTDLRILRNTIFAMYGYIFRDRNLNEYFGSQYWYYPNPNIKYNDIRLDKTTQKILDRIIEAEKKIGSFDKPGLPEFRYRSIPCASRKEPQGLPAVIPRPLQSVRFAAIGRPQKIAFGLQGGRI
jgi:hypothetical protein